MGLHYDFTKCHKPEEIDPSIKEAMIWTTIRVDMGDITQKNVQEFTTRVLLVEQLLGPILLSRTDWNNARSGRYLTPADIRRCIGLHTNVSYCTHLKWLSKVWHQFQEDAAKQIRRQNDALPQAAELLEKLSPSMQAAITHAATHQNIVTTWYFETTVLRPLERMGVLHARLRGDFVLTDLGQAVYTLLDNARLAVGDLVEILSPGRHGGKNATVLLECEADRYLTYLIEVDLPDAPRYWCYPVDVQRVSRIADYQPIVVLDAHAYPQLNDSNLRRQEG